MPKLPSVPFEEIIVAFKSRKDSLFDEYGKVMPPTAKVWSDIASDLKNRLHPKYLYTIVLENRKDCLSKLNLKSILEKEVNSGNSSISNSSEESYFPDKLNFNITLSKVEWDEIYPIDVTYRCHDPRRPSRVHRNYKILNPGVWTHKIAVHFYEQTSLSCAIVFRRAKIFNEKEKAVHFLKLSGYCKDCDSIFEGNIKSEPGDDPRVLINCKYYGSFKNCKGISKRQLSGNLRSEAIYKMINENIKPSMLRKLNANKSMEFGDKEPAYLPSTNVLRVAKSQTLKASRFHDDQILSLCMMKHIHPYIGIIKDIGYDKFFVHYWSTSELAVYKAYIKSTKFPQISIDATGSLVQKPLLVSNTRTKHIFLYEITINDKKFKVQYSVCHMLSEKHDNNSIYHWLAQWVRDVELLPKTVVCDQSLALIYASVRAFTQYSNLNDYLRICFDIAYKNVDPKDKIPNCFIRCDVAHVIKIFTTWPPLKNAHKRVKGFYIRVLAQILLSTDIEDVKSLLLAVFEVIYSETEGKDIRNSNVTSCEKSKLFLKRRIETGVPGLLEDAICNYEKGDIEILSENSSSEENIVDTHQENNFPDQNYNISENISSFYNLAKQYAYRSQKKVITEEGDHDNLHYIPTLAKYIIDQCKYLPLWSSIMIKSFGYGEKTASSASSESQWNDLKTRVLAHKNLPLRLEDFIETHILSIEGTMKLVAAKNLSSRSSQDITIQNPPSYSNVASITSSVEYAQINHTNNKNKKRCIACMNGDFPTGAHKCIQCEKSVHIFNECSSPLENEIEGYGTKRVCYDCSPTYNLISKTKFPQTDPDNFEEENWRNLAKKPSKKSIYLTPDPAFSLSNLHSKSKAKVIGLLKNGNSSKIQAVKINKKSYTLNNTCSFDSILQILAVCYADSKIYRQWVLDQMSTEPQWELVKSLVRDGTTVQSYRKRVKFMIQNFVGEPIACQNVELLSVESTAEQMLQKIIKDFPSMIETKECSSCKFRKLYPKHSVFIKISNLNIDHINEQLLKIIDPDDLEIYNCTTPNCNSFSNFTREIPNPHLFIDIMNDFEDTNKHDSDIESFVHIPLSSIPITLKLLNNNYYLRGCVVFTVGENPQLSTIGHYVAMCRRINNIWEIYDDQKLKPMVCNFKTQVNVHLLVYSK